MALTNAEQRDRQQRRAGTHEYRTGLNTVTSGPIGVPAGYDFSYMDSPTYNGSFVDANGLMSTPQTRTAAAGGTPGIDNGIAADAAETDAQIRQDWRERNARSIIEAELLNSSTNFYTDGATEFDSWLTENYLPQMQANFFGGGYDPTSVSSPISGGIDQQEARRQYLNRPDMQRQPNAMQQSTGRWSWWDRGQRYVDGVEITPHVDSAAHAAVCASPKHRDRRSPLWS
jgi:hypothetical protein